MILSKNDLHLVLAYFQLRTPRDYSPQEILISGKLRTRFLSTARTILGPLPEKAILLRLAELNSPQKIGGDKSINK